MQMLKNGFRHLWADALDFGNLFLASFFELLDRAKVLDQVCAPGWSQPGDGIQHRRTHALGALLAVIANGKAVRLITDLLQQIQSLRIARQDDWLIVTRDPNFFQTLGSAHQGHVDDA